MMTAIAILSLTVTPVIAGGGNLYESQLEYGRKRIPAGWVLVNYIEGGISIQFNTLNTPWSIIETHVEVAETMEEIPQAKGNPIPGQFTYSNTHDPMVKVFTYEIMVEGEQFYIAAHAVIYNECTGKYETAWGQGPNVFEFPGKNWAVGFTFPDPVPTD